MQRRHWRTLLERTMRTFDTTLQHAEGVTETVAAADGNDRDFFGAIGDFLARDDGGTHSTSPLFGMGEIESSRAVDHPPGWPFTSVVSEVHHTVAGAAFVEAADATSRSELAMIELQSLVSQRQEAVQLTTEIMHSIDDAMKSIIKNIGGGGGNGVSDHRGDSSDGHHPPGWPFSALADESHHAGAASQADQGATPEALDMPSFVSDLVNGTYDHIVQSSVQHMTDANSDQSNSSASDNGDHPPGWPFIEASGELHHAGATSSELSPHTAIADGFWNEAAHAMNGSSAIGLDNGNQLTPARVATAGATLFETHSVDGSGQSDFLSHDLGHDVASLEAAHISVVDLVGAHPVLEIAHAPEFATHLHL
jgi:hypothetical protein